MLMTENDAVSKLRIFFGFIFPETPDHRPNWNSPAYKPMFFDLFIQSGPSLAFTSEQLEERAIDWLSDRQLTNDNRGTIKDMCNAWQEWCYCRDNL